MTLGRWARSGRRNVGPQGTNMRRHARLVGKTKVNLEALEARCLLATGQATFAEFSGTLTSAKQSASIPMQVSPADFTMPAGRVLLGFELLASDSVGAHMAMPDHSGSRPRILQIKAPAAGASSVMLARVGRGRLNVQMVDERAAMGAFQLDVYLAGDTNGDHVVNRADLASIRSLLGVRAGQPGYTLNADVNRDGRINQHDLALARLNLGAATRVQPLSVALQVAPASDPDRNGVVLGSNVLLVGQTAPGATVLLTQSGSNAPQLTTANVQGTYAFAAPLPIGVTAFEIQAEDRFGQRSNTSLDVRRGDVVMDWNQTMLDAIRADKTTLGLTTRSLAMVQSAMYDAANDIEHFGAVYRTNVAAPPGASPVAAASEAAYRVLLDLYPAQKARFDATLAETLATVGEGQAKAEGIAVGDQVAQACIASRSNDGSSTSVPYVPGSAP